MQALLIETFVCLRKKCEYKWVLGFQVWLFQREVCLVSYFSGWHLLLRIWGNHCGWFFKLMESRGMHS